MDSQSNPWRNPKGSQIIPLNHQQNLTYPHKNLANSHKNLNNSRKWAKRGAPACFCHLKLCHQSNSHFCPRLCWESSLAAVSNCEARFNVYRLEKEGEQHTWAYAPRECCFRMEHLPRAYYQTEPQSLLLVADHSSWFYGVHEAKIWPGYKYGCGCFWRFLDGEAVVSSEQNPKGLIVVFKAESRRSRRKTWRKADVTEKSAALRC